MSKDNRNDRVDPDGVRIIDERSRRRAPAVWFFTAAAIVVAGVVFVRLTQREAGAPQPAPHAVIVRPKVELPDRSPTDTSSRPTSPRTRQLRAVHVDRSPRPPSDARANDQRAAAGQNATEDPEKAEQQQIEALARDMIDAAKQAGETGGLAAFPPPGTDPIKTGLVVPDDFELPEGYIRHYQTTDDGRRLEPILMFSPDYQFVDENGQPIPLPESGIVPPEMAPPGMPIRKLEMPKNPYGAPLGAR